MPLPKGVPLAVLSAVALCLAGCGQQGAAGPKPAPPPAKVAVIAKEAELNTIVLLPETESRLGIATAAVEMRRTERLRMYGGEVTLPTGAAIIVSAPIGGFLEPPPTGKPPAVGERVRSNQPIFSLVPSLSAEKSVLTAAEKLSLKQVEVQVKQGRIDADGVLEAALVAHNLAQVEFERAKNQRREGVTTVQQVDQRRAALDTAEKALGAAKKRKEMWDGVEIDDQTGTLKPVVIEAPHEGIVRTEMAKVGEAVALGAPLFEVMDSSVVWVKVPVYVGEADEIAADGPARLTSLEKRTLAEPIQAKPVSAPPTASALASTVDLYYEVDNRGGKLRPGQRLNAGLPLREEKESPCVPRSAVQLDINGGEWVYEQTAEHTYVRKRVQVRYVIDSWAVLANGPQVGAKVVTQGVAELFGTEFGFVK